MHFVIFGEPKAKGRPRFRNNGRYVQTYTDATTTNYENLVKLSYLEACGGVPEILKDEVEVCIIAYFSIPKSTSKKMKEAMTSGKILHTKKPDVDNLCKSILDGLNGVAYEDDKQVVKLSCMKMYSDEPRVIVSVKRYMYE